MATITCSKVTKSYGTVDIIKALDLEIRDREFVVLLGPSGCGKSTTLRMVAGLETIGGGTISIDGRVVNDVAPGDRGVAMVFQSYALYPHMTAYDNIAFGLRRQKVSAAEIEERVRKVSDILGLDALLQRLPKNLSGGQQQRVAMARAMIKTPKVFLFDEPLSNLDAKLREKLRTEIRKIHLALKTTTVFVTHDQLEAMTIADRIVLMRAGVIEQHGTPAEIYDRPATRFVADFIGSPATRFVTARVRLDGERASLDAGALVLVVPRGEFPDLADGLEVDVALRPSRMDRVDDRPEGAPDGAIRGVVTLVENMGSEAEVIVDVGGRELSFVTRRFADLARGSAVAFSIAPNHVHVFSRETGASLRRSPR